MRVLVALAASAWLCFGGELSNRRAPGFCLPDSSIRRYDLQDFRGKVLLLDFMQTNCPHCRALSGVLERAKARYGDKVAILSVVIAPPENQATVAKYISE